MPKTLKVESVRKACQLGNKLACSISLRIAPSLFGGAHITFANVDMEDENPNRMPYDGVLLLVDQASTKPPHGSRGHRIYVPKAVAKKRLSGLVGMGLNYSSDLESHAPRRKVGVITEAWLSGNKVKVKGFVYAKDFPEVKDDLKRGKLGMSMELANVYVDNEKADVWRLEDFHFTGATVLKKDAAAYYGTALAAQSETIVAGGKGDKAMAKTQEKTNGKASGQLELLVAGITKGVRQSIQPLVVGLKAQADGISSLRDDLNNRMTDMQELFQISAAAYGHDEEDDDELDVTAGADDDDDIDAGAEEDDDDDTIEAKGDDDDASDSSDSSDDASDVDAMEDLGEEDAEEEPGEVGSKRGGKNKGSKTTVTEPPTQKEKVKGNIAKGRLSSAGRGKKMKAGKPFPGLKSNAAGIQAAAVIGDLTAQVRQLTRQRRIDLQAAADLKKKMKKLNNKYEVMAAQVERAAENTDRRSALSYDIKSLAAKSNINLDEVHANGEKFTVGQIDQIFANANLNLDPMKKMELKNKFLQAGLMEQGEVSRVH